MSEYVYKDGITDIENPIREHGLTVREEAGIRPLAVAGDAGKLELKSQFVELRAKGWSYLKIARKLKVSKNTLANWGAELEGEIASLKAMELEALHEKYFMNKEARIHLLGEQLKEIKAELKRRGLEDVSTEKLLEMELKWYQALQAEYVETRPLTEGEMEILNG
jgi:transcriptional regulator with XRE-family HTH domain